MLYITYRDYAGAYSLLSASRWRSPTLPNVGQARSPQARPLTTAGRTYPVSVDISLTPSLPGATLSLSLSLNKRILGDFTGYYVFSEEFASDRRKA